MRICISNPFLNCDKIHPLQQRKISELLSTLLPNDNIKKIVIFGSSVTNKCHMGSDVDIYIELMNNTKERLVNKLLPFKFDLWTNYMIDERLKKEINSKGVLIYGRNIVR